MKNRIYSFGKFFASVSCLKDTFSGSPKFVYFLFDIHGDYIFVTRTYFHSVFREFNYAT